MIIDTSAMVAILYGEPEAAAFTRLIHDSATSRISVANYLELSMVIEKQLGPEGMRQADAFFRRAAIDIEPVTVEQGHLARQAFLDFGKGRHKAELRRLLCLRSRERFRRTIAVQGQRLYRDRYSFGSMTFELV